MKITICGSIAFYDQMLKVQDELKQIGHEVKVSPDHVTYENGQPIPVEKYYELRKKAINDLTSWIWDRKTALIRDHFEKIEWSDVILVLNYDKSNILGYIGENTFLEMGIAFHLNKKIFLLKQIPEIGYKEEIIGLKPIVINEDLHGIKA